MGVGKTVSNSRCFFVVFPLLGVFLPRAVPAGTPRSRPARGDQGGLAPLASLSGVRPLPPPPGGLGLSQVSPGVPGMGGLPA